MFLKINFKYTLLIVAFVFFECGCKSVTKNENQTTKSDSTSTQNSSLKNTTNGHIVTLTDLYHDFVNLATTIKSHNLSDDYYDKAVKALKSKNYTNAFNYLTSAIQVDSNNSGAYCFRAIIRTFLKNSEADSKAILSDFNMALKLNPKFILGYHYISYYKWNYMHDSIGALKDETIAVDLDTTNVRTLNQRFVMRREMHDYKGAIEDIDAIIRLNPNSSNYRYRGIVKGFMHNYAGAIIDYSKAIELNKQDTASYYNRALVEAVLQDYSKAMLDFSKAIENDPNMGLAYMYRGEVQVLIGKKDKGCEDLYKAQELGVQKAAAEISKFNCSLNK
ncbi:MAG TPA: hypothetical protein VNG53_02880 [Bacteroidia bacterium]|nr:hypothetical protein [Bacteroidia bacterium]